MNIIAHFQNIIKRVHFFTIVRWEHFIKKYLIREFTSCFCHQGRLEIYAAFWLVRRDYFYPWAETIPNAGYIAGWNQHLQCFSGVLIKSSRLEYLGKPSTLGWKARYHDVICSYGCFVFSTMMFKKKCTNRIASYITEKNVLFSWDEHLSPWYFEFVFLCLDCAFISCMLTNIQ